MMLVPFAGGSSGKKISPFPRPDRPYRIDCLAQVSMLEPIDEAEMMRNSNQQRLLRLPCFLGAGGGVSSTHLPGWGQ